MSVEVYNGMPVPQFAKGEFVSAGKLKKISRILRALVNPEVRYGPNPAAYITDNNLVLQVPRGGGGGSSLVQAFTLATHAGDYLTTDEGISIAKPYELRFSTTAATIDGISFTYPNGEKSVANQTRIAHWTPAGGSAQTENQVIVPRYLDGAVIWAIPVNTTGVNDGDGNECRWLEVQDGHAWAKKDAAIVFGTKSLTAGARTGSVTGLGLSSAPKQVLTTISDAVIFAVTRRPFTTDGFDYQLSAAPSDGSAKMDWCAAL